jgi:hypothetical protein
MPGCYALMPGFTQPLALDWDAALVREPGISWISVDDSKPGRTAVSSPLVQASNRWAEANMEQDDRAVIAQLVAETSRASPGGFWRQVRTRTRRVGFPQRTGCGAANSQPALDRIKCRTEISAWWFVSADIETVAARA